MDGRREGAGSLVLVGPEDVREPRRENASQLQIRVRDLTDANRHGREPSRTRTVTNRHGRRFASVT